MKTEKKSTLIWLELKWRDLLLTFSAVLFFTYFLDRTIPEVKKITIYEIPIYLPILMFLSYGVAVLLKKEVVKIFNVEDEDWTGEEDSKERWMIFYRYLGLTALYYVTQLGLCTIFIPEFIEYRFLNLPLYAICFLLNCYFISWIYSRTIYKSANEMPIQNN